MDNEAWIGKVVIFLFQPAFSRGGSHAYEEDLTEDSLPRIRK